MSKMTLLAAGTSPFAHLMAGFRGKRAEEEKPEDQEARDARRAEEDRQREEEDARRAEEDDRRREEDARRAEEDGTPADDKPDANKAEDDDEQEPEADAEDDDAEEGVDEKEKASRRDLIALGRRRENARCARIFGNPAAAGRPDLAATLAFTTRNTSAEAGRLLGAAGNAPAPRARTLDRRMAERTDARPGAGGGAAPSKTSFADRVAAAVKKAGR